MARRIVSAREQVELLAPWRTAAEDSTPPGIHDIMPGRFSDGNGRWDYRHQETSGDRYLRHEYGIHPVSSPASHSYVDHRGKTYTVHYDPALTGGQLPRPGKWGHEWENPDAIRNKLTDLNPPPGMLWRGMSREEYEKSRERGYFESAGDHNFGSQQGLTFFSTKPEQAANYATWFAPPAYKPTFTHPGYVVGIPDRPNAPRGAIPGEKEIGSTEVGLPGRVPFSEATHHYVGQVSTLTPGSQGVTEGWNGWEESGGTQGSSDIMWSQLHPGQHTAARRLAERADKFEWIRGSGGNWELSTRTPDGQRVIVDTSPSRGQYTTAARYHTYGPDVKHIDPVVVTTKSNVARDLTEHMHLAADDYRGYHQAPDAEYGAPLHDVEMMFPDYHQHPEHYRTYQPYDHQSESKILRYRGRPDAKVDVYRALPMSAATKSPYGMAFPLNGGDWVTTSYDYAKEHGESNLDHHGPWTILHAKAPASNLFTEGNSIHEWAYHGDNKLAIEHPTARSQRYRRNKRRPL